MPRKRNNNANRIKTQLERNSLLKPESLRKEQEWAKPFSHFIQTRFFVRVYVLEANAATVYDERSGQAIGTYFRFTRNFKFCSPDDREIRTMGEWETIVSSFKDIGVPYRSVVADKLVDRMSDLVDDFGVEIGQLVRAAPEKDLSEFKAYRRLLSHGKRIVPHVLPVLHTAPMFWFAALKEIVRHDPVKQSSIGNQKAMADDWRDYWAEKQPS